MLIINEALLFEGEVSEYLLLLLFDLPQSTTSILFMWVLFVVIEIYSKLILE